MPECFVFAGMSKARSGGGMGCHCPRPQAARLSQGKIAQSETVQAKSHGQQYYIISAERCMLLESYLPLSTPRTVNPQVYVFVILCAENHAHRSLRALPQGLSV